MSRHPEQDRALAYLRRKGTDAPAEQVRAKVALTVRKLERTLDRLGPKLAALKPDADTWCVQEVANHLAVSLEPAVAPMLALAAGQPPGDPIPAGLIEKEAMAVSWPAALGRLKTAHARFLEAVDHVVEADPPLDRTAPALLLIKIADSSGVPVPVEWIEELDWKGTALVVHVHTLEHLDQIRRILDRVQPSGT